MQSIFRYSCVFPYVVLLSSQMVIGRSLASLGVFFPSPSQTMADPIPSRAATDTAIADILSLRSAGPEPSARPFAQPALQRAPPITRATSPASFSSGSSVAR